MKAAVDMHVLHHPRLAAASPKKLIVGGALLAIGLVALEAIAAPARADAFLGLPDPAEIVKDGVKSSFDFVLQQLFGGVPTKITEAAVSWQLHLPAEAFHNSNVAELNRTTTAAAFALLSLVMTASVLRFWLGGLVDGGAAADGVTGFVRGIGAALGVVAWPWAFNSSIALVNSLTFELIHANSVHDDVSRMLGAAVGIQLQGGPFGLLASAVIVVVGTLLMLGLFTLHIVLSSALVVMFVGGPLLIVLAPFPGTAWLSTVAMRAFVTLLTWPVIWAICFACFAAVFNDFVTFRGDGGVLDKTLVKPLTGVAMLYLCVRLPLLATKASMAGIGTLGTVGFAARYFAVRQVGQLGTHGTDGGNGRAGSGRPGRRVAARAGAGPRAASAAPATGSPVEAVTAATSGARAPPSATPSSGPISAASALLDETSRSSRPTASMPASVRALGARPNELEQEMLQARRRAGAPGQPAAATEADVQRAMKDIGGDSASALGNTYDRAIASGHNREAAMNAVTRTAAIGAARAEVSDRPTAIRAALRTIGSAPPHAFASGLEAYRADAAADRPPSGRPAPGPADAPSPAAPRPRATERRAGEVS